ncbi:MAG: uracil phosphoribosyltransferase [Verrucomicrobiae bacterium]|nr:uracil phosphoribosyltransferase [Verrucomicrobiae bacterium]NNJ43667.1 uracil phosphoribosyltransferase [Akkermansiaceae bacterium]
MNHPIQHPVIDDRMARLRQRDCPSSDFRRFVQEIAQLMVPAVTANFPTLPVEIETPLEITTGQMLAREIVLVPILRAGLGMLEGFHRLLPEASVAHVGVARNEDTLIPESYYFNAPANIQDAQIIILDPMLATGGSASTTMSKLKNHGAQHIHFACLVAAPEGLKNLHAEHPDVPVYYAALDTQLNQQGYILPGLGDAGDRIFGTVRP